MSQFRGDNHGPLDSNQKTLTSFFICGEEATRKFSHVENLAGFPMSNNRIIPGELNSASDDSSYFINDDDHFNISYESDVISESNQLVQPAYSLCNDAHEINSMDVAWQEVCSFDSLSISLTISYINVVFSQIASVSLTFSSMERVPYDLHDRKLYTRPPRALNISMHLFLRILEITSNFL